MILFLLVLSVVLGWLGGYKAYHEWLSKKHIEFAAKIYAIGLGFCIWIISFILLNAIFDSVWTAILFLILCLVLWVGFKDSRLLRLTPSSKLLTRKQMCIYFGVSCVVLAVMGADTKPDHDKVAQTNTPLPMISQNTEKPVEDKGSQDNPFDNDQVSSTVETNQLSTMVQQEPSAETTVVEEPEPVIESSEDDETTVFHEQDNNSCSGLPSRCTEMRDCKQAYQALECGNYKLDRDDDGIPCESICG